LFPLKKIKKKKKARNDDNPKKIDAFLGAL
jgi:hypothetical protein